MNLWAYLFKILLWLAFTAVAAYGLEVRHNKQQTIIYPYGLPTRQPPAPGRVIELPSASLSIKARQVCGYTDFSSVQLNLPKQLLSKEYWSKIGNNLLKQAKQQVLDLSYALPAMLSCNISPTWCANLNPSQIMAAFEGQLSLNTCDILDGLSTEAVWNEDLKQCMKAWEGAKGLTPIQARERCLTNGNVSPGGITPQQQAENIKQAREAAENGASSAFSFESFMSELIPDAVSVTSSSSQQTSLAGNHLYSRRSRSLKLAAKLFSGIEVRSSAYVGRAGTFQSNVESHLNDETVKVKSKILSILKEMKKWEQQGFQANDVIEKSRSSWDDKNEWKKAGEPAAIMRSSIDGSDPSYLVTPEQIYALLPLAEDHIDEKTLQQVVDRISQSTAYVKVQDSLADIQTGALIKCVEPKNQSAVAQKNCDHILKRSQLAMQVLEHKMLGEERVRKVQEEVGSIINEVQAAKLSQTIAPLPDYSYRKPEGRGPLNPMEPR